MQRSLGSTRAVSLFWRQEMNVSILISAVAVVLSLIALSYQRTTQRKELLLRVYEGLLEPEQQKGRRLLFELAEQEKPITELDQDDVDCVNHALASLNILGFLYGRGYIPRRDALDLWGVPAARAWKAAHETGMFDRRDGQEGRPVWPHFRAFACKARNKFYAGGSVETSGQAGADKAISSIHGKVRRLFHATGFLATEWVLSGAEDARP
jgi:hypothetical protein